MELGHKFETEIGGKKVSVETGKYCGQANGSVIVRCQDTVVMVNTTMAKEPRPAIDFFPLGVDYEEKMYAVGKIPGGFKRREGRASDKAILTSRLIDRPLRPLFDKGFFNDVAVVATPLSVDPDVMPEPLAMLGSSVALSISDIPFEGPTGSVVVALIDGKYIMNPTLKEREESRLHLTVSGTKEAVLMVEAGAKEVTEEEMLKGILLAHEEIKKQVAFQEEIVKKIGRAKIVPNVYRVPDDMQKAVDEYAFGKMEDVFNHYDRQERTRLEEELEAEVQEHFKDVYPEHEKDISNALYNEKKAIVRRKIINDGIRPDGRKIDEIRPIWCEAGILPRVHGTGVFTRGQTQVITTCTLGMLGDMQKLEGIDEEEEKRYMHHYNMPGYSTGEAKPLKSPGRREIGHGALAERSLEPVLPSEEEFPYAIRTVSEVVSSNGSTSQASVCGSTLALMDAGVPIKAPVAGIAMGLMKDKESGKVVVLSDIQGLEDFFGDMDFKVAGTTKGITAIQMDIKIHGIDEKILREALERARIGRLFILDKMLAVLPEPRKQLSPYAPKIISFSINPDKIGDVIGKQGAVINKIIEETGVKIDISDEGVVSIASTDELMNQKAKNIILAIATDIEKGQKFVGKVVRILQFGAFVELCPGKEGMIHISKLSDKHVDKVEDVVKVDDKVEVEVIKVDEKGRIDLKLVEKK
ncbi:MAG: polyribonucleotide nucleotidyltransferase [Clostridiales bacterium]|nr:polyribonucleotide nucleotidyltransferase [Candidatus Apopatousia equi]